MRRRFISPLLVAAMLIAPPAALGQIGLSDDPTPAVFQLEIVKRDDAGYKSMGHGTGFFTADDGTALTVSHVVYPAQQDPDHYQLLAIVNKEFYTAQVVCASKLPYDPIKLDPAASVPFGRDVAQVRIAPSTFPFRNWILTLKTGEHLTIATAHRDATPRFPYLLMGGRPREGQHIRVIGFGHISPIARMFTADGQIDRMGRASDGTEIFSGQFTSRPQPGNSGSPVIDDENRVVGIWPWGSKTHSNIGNGISSSALAKPCP